MKKNFIMIVVALDGSDDLRGDIKTETMPSATSSQPKASEAND